MINIKVFLDEGANIDDKAYTTDAGMDLRTKESVVIPAHGYCAVDTGVHMLIPDGYVGMLKSKSGLNVKHHLRGEGVIDAGYTGSIVVKMYNDGDADYVFEKGDKLIQIVILPIPETSISFVDAFGDDTQRGDCGFGSTGK